MAIAPPSATVERSGGGHDDRLGPKRRRQASPRLSTCANSRAKFVPLLYPSSAMRRSKASQIGAALGWALSAPTPTIFSVCCARAASGHAAAPPSSVTKSRRLDQHGASSPRAGATNNDHRGRRLVGLTLSLLRACQEVLGSDLNRATRAAERITHHGGRLLQCGISIRPLSGLGHSRPRRAKRHAHARPLCPEKQTKCRSSQQVRFVPIVS